jgi:hypothetical protein
MAKINPRGNSLFNLKSFNELKKDQTKIKIFKNSSFDSSFNSVQSLNTNYYHLFSDHHLSLPSTANAEESKKKRANRLPLSEGFGFALVSPAAFWPNANLAKTGDHSSSEAREKQVSTKNFKNPSCKAGLSAILRAIRSIRLNRDEWKLIRYINLMEKKIRSSPPFGSILEQSKGGKIKNILKTPPLISGILSKNILLQNMKYNFLKSTLSTILKKKIRTISEVLENKPIKNYVLYSYLKNCIFTPPHLNVGRTKLSLNKYKGRKFGSFINYNKIIEYKFNSALPLSKGSSPALQGGAATSLLTTHSFTPKDPLALERGEAVTRKRVRGVSNIYIKDTYKLLFYLFKSMYCLISKPILKNTNDKVTIQLFYYLNIPKKKVFRLFSIFYINSIKKKWLAQSHPSFGSPNINGVLQSRISKGVNLSKIYIR